MALERNLDVVSYPAQGDLSASLFHLLAVGASGTVGLAAGSTGAIVGVLQSKPKVASEGAAVAIGGVSKCVAGTVISVGDLVTSDANGRAIPSTTTGNVIAGRAVTAAAASGDIFELQVEPHVL